MTITVGQLKQFLNECDDSLPVMVRTDDDFYAAASLGTSLIVPCPCGHCDDVDCEMFVKPANNQELESANRDGKTIRAVFVRL